MNQKMEQKKGNWNHNCSLMQTKLTYRCSVAVCSGFALYLKAELLIQNFFVQFFCSIQKNN